MIRLFLIFCFSIILAPFTKTRGQSDHITYLEDNRMKIGIDLSGRIAYLENKQDGRGNIIDKPADGIFSMVCKRGENWEDVVIPERLDYHVSRNGSSIRIRIDQIVTRDAASNVSLLLSLTLSNGQVRFDAEIDNRQEGLMVTDFVYPKIGVIKTLGTGKPDLLWPNQAGEWCTNIGDALSGMPDTRESPNTKWITYPGTASMQWMALVDGDQCLYFSGRDSDFYSSTLRATGSNTDKGAITLSINRFSFVKTNEKWQSPASVLALYKGSWRKGADDYKKWAATWRKNFTPRKWVQDMQGYFLVINKQQYGDEMWSYDKLPLLYEKARSHGFDVLGLFGWYHSGHDNMYPDIGPGETLGGADMLKENIAKVRKDGGNITLYYQGHLIDVNSEYYKTSGHTQESKSFWGVPYYEKYNKYHKSDFLRSYTSKTFSTICPSSVEWQDMMVEKAKDIARLGPSGILYDQIGGMPPNPCFDETHNHKYGKPSLSYTSGRLSLLDKIYRTTREINPDYAFFTEHITDVYSQFTDCLHGINSRPGGQGSRLAMLDDSKAVTINYPELFRYCFPNTVITVRNPFPYITPQYVNYAAAIGLRFEMELRYLDDCTFVLDDHNPAYREYAAKVSALRKKHWNVLGYGRFIDEEKIDNRNLRIVAKAFEKDRELKVVLWNDNDTGQEIDLDVPGYSLKEVSTVDKTEKALPQEIDPQQIIIASYVKN